MEKNLTALVEQAGIVGAGGAGFPTHVKVNAKAEYVIINGAECEPLLRVDQQLMALEAEKLLSALQLLVDHVGALEGIVALKDHYHNAVNALQPLMPKFPKLRLHLMGNFYPAGDEQIMVYEVTKRIIPEGGIPLNVGVIVTNVETALNVYNAYYNEKPVTDKYVTVTGSVLERKTFKVPLGVTVRELIAMAGGATIPNFVVINGGPMMGKLIDLDAPINKTVKGLIVISPDHPLIRSLTRSAEHSLKSARMACMQCSLCSEVCPRGLLGHRIEPHKMMRLAGYGDFCDPKTSPVNAFLCCGCRLCEYACVMDLQPWKVNNELKTALGAQQVKNPLHNTPEHVKAFRDIKRFPITKLIARLGLSSYDLPAPMDFSEHSFDQVCLPLKQHVGVPSSAVVGVGDTVNKGDLIARIPEGKLGSNIHASISGKVVSVSSDSITIKA